MANGNCKFEMVIDQWLICNFPLQRTALTTGKLYHPLNFLPLRPDDVGAAAVGSRQGRPLRARAARFLAYGPAMPHRSPACRRACRFERMESRQLMAADLAPPLLEQPAGELLLPDGELFLPGSISGRVFAAQAADGAYQAGDAGIAGVRIELLASDGRLLAEAFTDDAGRYDFPALAPGVYAVREVQPAGFDDGPDWFGDAGGWVEANDLISQIVVLPGADLDWYDFAERLALLEPETPTSEPVEEPTPNPTPLPIDEAPASPLAGFVPLPTVEWRLQDSLVQEEAVITANDVAAPPAAPLTQRRGEPIFGSGSRPSKAFDFDAAIAEGYDVLATFFQELGDAYRVIDGESDSAADASYQGAAAAPSDAARESAFEEAGQLPIADAPAPVAAPARRVDSAHQLAGKPAA